MYLNFQENGGTESVNYTLEGGELSFYVNPSGWATVSASGGRITVTVGDNPGVARSCEIIPKVDGVLCDDNTISVRQAGSNCGRQIVTYSWNPVTVRCGKCDTETSVTLNGTATVAYENCDRTEPPVSTSMTETYYFSANGTDRERTMTFGPSDNVTVIQAAGPCDGCVVSNVRYEWAATNVKCGACDTAVTAYLTGEKITEYENCEATREYATTSMTYTITENDTDGTRWLTASTQNPVVIIEQAPGPCGGSPTIRYVWNDKTAAADPCDDYVTVDISGTRYITRPGESEVSESVTSSVTYYIGTNEDTTGRTVVVNASNPKVTINQGAGPCDCGKPLVSEIWQNASTSIGPCDTVASVTLSGTRKTAYTNSDCAEKSESVTHVATFSCLGTNETTSPRTITRSYENATVTITQAAGPCQVDTEYRWYTTTTYCSGEDLYAHQVYQYSEDGGSTWQNVVPEATQETLIERGAAQCSESCAEYTITANTSVGCQGGTVTFTAVSHEPERQYRWFETNTYCNGEDLYAHEVYQYSTDGGQTWKNVSPEQTRERLKEAGSAQCGDTPQPPEPGTQERWVVVPGEYLCSGYGKYEMLKKQVSEDGGITWEDAEPEELKLGEVIEYASEDCIMAVISYLNGSETNVERNRYAQLEPSDVRNPSDVSDVVINDCGRSIWSETFKDCVNMTSVTISDSVTDIGDYCFKNCTSLTTVRLPRNLEDVNTGVFNGCTSLTSVTFQTNLESIGGEAFSGCTNLTSITLPNGLKYINGESFRGCTSLTSVTIPASVTWIGSKYVFDGCTSLRQVVIRATTPPTLDEDYGPSFENCNNCLIKVPSSSVQAYKEAEGWSNYADRIVSI